MKTFTGIITFKVIGKPVFKDVEVKEIDMYFDFRITDKQGKTLETLPKDLLNANGVVYGPKDIYQVSITKNGPVIIANPNFYIPFVGEGYGISVSEGRPLLRGSETKKISIDDFKEFLDSNWESINTADNCNLKFTEDNIFYTEEENV